jgi:S-adenosylmethionine/arginine decarboxylase-like enzyme
MGRDTREIFDFNNIEQSEIVLANDLPPIDQNTEDSLIVVHTWPNTGYTPVCRVPHLAEQRSIP